MRGINIIYNIYSNTSGVSSGKKGNINFTPARAAPFAEYC
jgi:hypothetical protein